MFKVTVYDDAKPSFPFEVFTDENELKAIRKGMNALRCYRSSGRAPLGNFAIKLTKEG
jgi:hypothetical protein